MRHRPFTILALISLTLCTAAAWDWNRWGGIWVPWPQSLPSGPFFLNQGSLHGYDNDWLWGTFLGFKLVVHVGEGGMDGRWLVVPGWLAFTACVPLAAWSITKMWRESIVRSRLDNHLCPSCGYDLRATPRQCPECGTVQK